ncbi:MAG: LytTR family transcriptional regulator [Lachnospiraceae bacterium]|jgi:DNA-binding LytR/AlgR family response regulator|nr:LytTR family transcriptional regulator [Lachnospiraceae bacterium]MCI8955519.1 LytTR family transcriptional regulator [Eubacterium sp.]MCI9105879.1 LytTR family transcriptional regulator [Lachnospiraceae bacterium]
MITKMEEAMYFTDCHKNQYQLFPEDIFYVEADNIYSWIICKGQTIRVPHPIILMQELLPAYFIRIHRSFLINQYFITAIYSHTVIMSNGFRLPIPKKKYQWLKKHLETFDLNHPTVACEGTSTKHPL